MRSLKYRFPLPIQNRHCNSWHRMGKASGSADAPVRRSPRLLGKPEICYPRWRISGRCSSDLIMPAWNCAVRYIVNQRRYRVPKFHFTLLRHPHSHKLVLLPLKRFLQPPRVRPLCFASSQLPHSLSCRRDVWDLHMCLNIAFARPMSERMPNRPAASRSALTYIFIDCDRKRRHILGRFGSSGRMSAARSAIVF